MKMFEFRSEFHWTLFFILYILIDNKPTLVQMMAWRLTSAASHYLKHWWSCGGGGGGGFIRVLLCFITQPWLIPYNNTGITNNTTMDP